MSYSSLLVQDLITSVPTWLLQYPCTWLPRQWGAQTAVETMTANNSLRLSLWTLLSTGTTTTWSLTRLRSPRSLMRLKQIRFQILEAGEECNAIPASRKYFSPQEIYLNVGVEPNVVMWVASDPQEVDEATTKGACLLPRA